MMALFRIQVCVLLLTILLCLIQYISSTIILEAIGSLNDKNTTEVSERIFRNVDMIENTVKNTWTIIIHHSKLIKSAFGLLILFYGGEFRNTVIFIQALMITGLPIISKYANTLYQSYKINRDTLRKELPDIIQAEADVADLALAIESDSLLLEQLEAKLASNEISMQEFIQDARPIRAKLKKSKELMQKTQAVQNSIGQLKHSLHIQHLQDALSALYQSITVGIAAVCNQKLGAITMGLNLGKLAHVWTQRIFISWRRFFNRDNFDEEGMLLEKNAEWLIVFALSTSRLVGVVVSLFLEDTMAALSQCALGSHLLVETAEAWLDPVLERLNLPAIKNTPVLAVLAHSIIFGIGIWQTVLVAVFGAEPKTMPSILKVLLSPLRAFEFILSKFVIS